MTKYIYYFMLIIVFILEIIYMYKYFKILRQKENYIKVKGIVTYSNSLLTRNGYKTYCLYKYSFQGKEYEAKDMGFGKNLKKLNDEVIILINENNPTKYLSPMKYDNRNRYLIFGIII